MAMKVQEYVLIEPYEWDGHFVLPAGALAKPIEERWVPEHVKEAWRCIWTPSGHGPKVFVYTYYGFVLIPEKLLRQLD